MSSSSFEVAKGASRFSSGAKLLPLTRSRPTLSTSDFPLFPSLLSPTNELTTNTYFKQTSTNMQHPSTGDHLVVTFPLPKVLQLRLNRPEALNAMTDAMEEDIRKMLDWYEEENSLWAVVITGTGRAFCAGQDLKDWQKTAATRQSPSEKMKANPHGFGSLARRRSKKPIIIGEPRSVLLSLRSSS